MARLIVVGACYLDTILTVPYYPGEDEKLRATSIVRRRGGNGPNTLEVLQQLSEHTSTAPSLSLCSVLPARDSVAVKEIQDSLGPRVDLSRCIYRAEHSEAASSYIIRSSATGSRTIVNYNGLPEMTRDEFTSVTDALSNEEYWYHFEGRIPDTTLECIKYIREHHPTARISVEVEKPGRAGLQDLANLVDVVFYSKGWAQDQGFESARDFLMSQKHSIALPTLLFCTWGDQGATVFDRLARHCISVPASLPASGKVIDSTGAGDTFIAGVLFCLLRQRELEASETIKIATKLAGCKVAQEGFEGLVKRNPWLQEHTT